MNNNEYILDCTSCSRRERIIEKYPVLKNYNMRIDHPYPDENAERIIIEVRDLRKFYDDIQEEIIISRDITDEGIFSLEIYDAHRE